jgi:small subunit ribosomal protein S21
MASNTNIYIEVSEYAPIEKVLRRFKRQCDSFGIVKEYRERQDYKKPSVKQKLKLEASVKRKAKTSRKGFRSSKM